MTVSVTKSKVKMKRRGSATTLLRVAGGDGGAQEREHRVKIEVQDTGDGISLVVPLVHIIIFVPCSPGLSWIE